MSGSFARLIVLQCNIAMVGCSSASNDLCTRDEDCASGFCRADGTCGPSPVDGGPDSDAPIDGSQLCAPNNDNQIALTELPLVAGRMATFRVALDPAFDTAGTSSGGGTRSWDLSGQLANDTDRTIALLSPTGTWWVASFPTATYAAPLSSESTLLGVFAVDASALTLLGVVSPEAGAFRTELAYDPPAKILALPFGLTGTSTWVSTSTVSGVAQGGIVAYSERYDSRVDHTGTMKTPYGEFPVLRVATDLDRTSGGATLSSRRSFTWVAECFGSIATVSSQDFETSAEFTDPAEVRRLAP
ncbi:MAG TPA: hypothetical protein VIU61_15655 [Kofleriaceae bacterium]